MYVELFTYYRVSTRFPPLLVASYGYLMLKAAASVARTWHLVAERTQQPPGLCLRLRLRLHLEAKLLGDETTLAPLDKLRFPLHFPPLASTYTVRTTRRLQWGTLGSSPLTGARVSWHVWLEVVRLSSSSAARGT